VTDTAPRQAHCRLAGSSRNTLGESRRNADNASALG
jgi:hypothetical protein